MIESIKTKKVHREAMILMQNALVAEVKGDNITALRLFSAAFDLERAAALDLTNALEKEPTRSVLFRSAASLAMNCGRFEEGEAMIALGLLGNPPRDIADELRDVAKKIKALKQKTKTTEKSQLAVVGNV